MLKLLLALPLFGSVLLLLLPARNVDLLRRVAAGVAALTVVCATLLLIDFDPGNAEMQFFETRPWNPRLGTHLALGVDGISLPMVLLATFSVSSPSSRHTPSGPVPSSIFRSCSFSKRRC